MDFFYLDSKHKAALDDFVSQSVGCSLLQTWQWGEFQRAAGFKIWRLGVENNGKLVGAATILKYDMPRGKWYLYSPRFLLTNVEVAEIFFKEIKKIAEKEKCIFLRIDPLISEGELNLKKNFEKICEEFSAVKAPKEIQPKNTIIVDLKKDEEEILKRMKSKTRYNIRLSKRKGVSIRQSVEQKDVEAFYKIAKETSSRDKFFVHEKKYYGALVQVLSSGDFAKLFIAEYEGKIFAVNINSFYKDTAVYLHGASSNEHRNLMAPHLLQWEAMLEAKRRGIAHYDLGGVAPKNSPKHSWTGITKFKEGFGGKRIDYVGAWDIVYNKFWYNVIKAVLKFKI